MNNQQRAQDAVVGYLMRGGYIKKEERAKKVAKDLILTVIIPSLRWDLGWEHEEDIHRTLRAELEEALDG